MNMIFSVLVLVFTLGFGSTATACPSEMQALNACTTWDAAQNSPLDGQPQRGQNDPAVSCVEMVSRTPTVLLVYEGAYVPDVDTAGVRVVTKFRHVSDWKQRDDGMWSKMVCITKRWMNGIRSFTICGDNGHYYFNSTETGYFKRQSGALTPDDVAHMWQGG
ncbi:MAG: hypothetical protein ACI9SY_000254 [Candidatus Paceibacteria bacterium]|jgi:hypothetical protein